MLKRKALGKGLSALIPEADQIETSGSGFFMCPVEDIEPNPYQPRQRFSDKEMEEMVSSVKDKGILTPLLVTRSGEKYRIIAGERRWRAAKEAGLDRIPAVLRDASPVEALELAIIENIHREDLNPIEEATAYKRLMEEGGLTQEAVAKKLGKERSSIANTLRLLKLPREYQQDVIDGRMSMGHARVIVGVESPEHQKRLRDAAVKSGLSVRQLEALARRLRDGKKIFSRKANTNSHMSAISMTLEKIFNTKVEIRKKKKGGSIVLHFSSEEQLNNIVDSLKGTVSSLDDREGPRGE